MRTKRDNTLKLLLGHSLILLLLLPTTIGSSLTKTDNATTTDTKLLAEDQHNHHELQVSGWPKIKPRWPIAGQRKSHFFVFKKGHHFIEVKLPNNLDDDLEANLEYYFNHTNIRPAFQLIPCNGSGVGILDDDNLNESMLKPGWHNHTFSVKREACRQRNRLTYNIILHDEDDVFAWSSLAIRASRANQEQQVKTTTSTTGAPATDTSSTIASITTATVSTGSAISSDNTSSTKVPAADSASRARSMANLEQVRGDEDALESADMDKVFENKEQRRKLLTRPRRQTSSGWSLICTPEDCNKTLVEFPDFLALIGGLDDLHENSLANQKHRYYLNTENEPLNLTIQSEGRDLASVDVCVRFSLFMDAGTYIDLKLNDHKLTNGHRLLERFNRTEGHWASGGWETIKRCMSSYLPKLLALQADEQLHRLELSLVPRSEQTSRDKILVKFVDGLSSSFGELTSPLKYLPNAADLERTEEVEKLWIINKELLRRPQFRLTSANETVGSRSQVLLVENIEPTLEHFDLISRWIQIDEPDLLDNSTMFHYKLADKPQWISSIDFSFQRADTEPEDDWHTEQFYSRETSDSTSQSTEKAQVNTTTQSKDHIAIKLKSVSSGKAFRLRLRHYLDESLKKGANWHQLTIRTLSMGDACVLDRPVCLNQGRCKPTGITRAKCSCLRGFSGEHCELRQPCDIIQAGALSGHDLCVSVGAKCVPNIPVFRCTWPDDIYYRCEALSAPSGLLSSESTRRATIATATSTSSSTNSREKEENENEDDATRLQKLEDRVRKQSRLTFVLSILLTITVFICVIAIVNLVAKLQKSKNRLETAQVGVHELTRRFRPISGNGMINLGEDNEEANGPDAKASSNPRRRAFDTANSFKVYNNNGFDATN